MSETPLLQLQDIHRHFKSGDTEVKALNGISLSIWQGEFVAIMGQSGSGKTTLMNLLGCLDKPSSGSYQVMGKEATIMDSDELAELRRETFGFVFQRYNLLATSTAEENVEMPAMYAGQPKAERLDRARALLARIGLGERVDHKPNQLSGGQQQRVAIARALVNNPPVILADEPTGALDSHSGQEVMEWIKQLHTEGRTIILITHDEQVASHADRIIRIQDGKILEDSMPQGAPRKDKDYVPLTHVIRPESIASETHEAIVTALRALKANLFRTALTLLGIIIGVAAVITMLAIGNGSKQKVLAQINNLGTNVLTIRTGAPGIRPSNEIATLVVQDAEAVSRLPNVDYAVPVRQVQKTIRIGNLDMSSEIQGVTQNYPDTANWPVTEGSFFTKADVDSYAPVAVIGKTVRDLMFSKHKSPIGQFLLVGTIPFQIIGVMDEKGASPFGSDMDNVVFIPLTTGFVSLFSGLYVERISIKVHDTRAMDTTQEAVRQLLLSRHRTEDFQVRSSAEFLNMATEAQTTLTILLGAVAAISLLVGGIGVMNIMLVSVTERTREIGMRMAVGARMRNIQMQFVTEAAVICTIGGMIGVAIGFITSGIIALFDVEIVFTVAPPLIAFASAVATGLLFGYLPARKAARLDPVIALSAE